MPPESIDDQPYEYRTLVSSGPPLRSVYVLRLDEIDPIRPSVGGVEHLPTPLIRFIGVSELVGAVGLLVPWYTQVWPILTPIAAVCLGLIMLPAGVIHYRRGEIQTVWRVNVTVLLLCGFVADGRFV